MSEPLPDFDGLLNWQTLTPWIEQQDLPGTGPVTKVERPAGGSQNAVFILTRGNESFVLRRPPKHPRKNSNDIMMREARVLKALAGSHVPHPQFYAACEDLSVLGVSFYTMGTLEGFSPSQELPGRYGTDRAWRHEMGPEFVRAAAALAAIDYKAVGLEDWGKPDNWHSRQVDRWRTQLESYRETKGYPPDALPHVDEVGRWLTDNMPADKRIGINHGDFQWPNIMFSLKAPKISGLIDWEMSTLGDPMLDLGWLLSSWREPGDPTEGGPRASGAPVKPWDGFISRKEIVRMYGELTGRDMTCAPWFFTLACYKLACVLEGSHARAIGGQIPFELGQHLHNYALWLIAKARQLASGAPI